MKDPLPLQTSTPALTPSSVLNQHNQLLQKLCENREHFLRFVQDVYDLNKKVIQPTRFLKGDESFIFSFLLQENLLKEYCKNMFFFAEFVNIFQQRRAQILDYCLSNILFLNVVLKDIYDVIRFVKLFAEQEDRIVSVLMNNKILQSHLDHILSLEDLVEALPNQKCKVLGMICTDIHMFSKLFKYVMYLGKAIELFPEWKSLLIRAIFKSETIMRGLFSNNNGEKELLEMLPEQTEEIKFIYGCLYEKLLNHTLEKALKSENNNLMDSFMLIIRRAKSQGILHSTTINSLTNFIDITLKLPHLSDERRKILTTVNNDLKTNQVFSLKELCLFKLRENKAFPSETLMNDLKDSFEFCAFPVSGGYH